MCWHGEPGPLGPPGRVEPKQDKSVYRNFYMRIHFKAKRNAKGPTHRTGG